MKYILPILLFFCLETVLLGQVVDEPEDGSVSYITSQNVYVKFKTTDHINVGDTLFVKKGESLVPALVVSNKSSMSCVCTPITPEPFSVSDKIITRQKPEIKPAGVEKAKEEPVKDQPQNNEPVGKATKTGTIKHLTNPGPGLQDNHDNAHIVYHKVSDFQAVLQY